MDLIYTIFQNFFAFVIILSVLVFVHEYGHYLGCKICGVKVDSFSIGMGKELWGWTDKSGVRWKVSMLPFGGYLKMYGDDDVASGQADKEVIEKMSEDEKKVSFYFQNPYKKFLIVFFGPFFNLIFAVLLLTCIYRITGIDDLKPVISEVMEDSPAEIAGLQKDDYIVAINDEKIENFSQVMNIIAINNLQPLTIEVLRNGETVELNVQPKIIKTKDMFGNDVETSGIGITSKITEPKKVNVFQAFIQANKSVYKMCVDTLIVLGQMITGDRSTDGLGGPLKIAQYSGQSFEGGWLIVLYFMALISANLGLMNLLPIPVLDGGHLLFFIIEIIARRPIPDKIQEKLLQGGFGILILIMVFATFNDFKSILF